jgi:DNA polymerase
MPNASFDGLLDATIRHLEDLREHGVRHVAMDPRALTELAQPPRAAPPVVAPAVRTAAPNPIVTTMPRPAVPARPPTPPAPAPVQPRLPVTEPRRRDFTRAEKEAAMASLRQQALACQKCSHLAAARKHVVFGVGDIHSPLMFVGEAPGADEDEQGEPFVGKAGQLLTRIIQTMGLTRETVYIANILKCRPDTPGQAAGNRKPTPTEMVTCLPYLLEQIAIIQPKAMVALGATALEGLFGKTEGISRARGRWLTFQDTPVMPTYHPAYLLRNQALTEKRKVWEDMLAVMTRLGLPISE